MSHYTCRHRQVSRGAGFDELVLEFLRFPDREPGVSLRAGAEESARLFDAPEAEQIEVFVAGDSFAAGAGSSLERALSSAESVLGPG